MLRVTDPGAKTPLKPCGVPAGMHYEGMPEGEDKFLFLEHKREGPVTGLLARTPGSCVGET